VTSERSGAWWRRDRRTVTAHHVVLAAGTWGTQRLLHALRSEGVLPRVSPRLGELTRTNSEALVGAMATRVPDADLTRGVAITSSFYPRPDTHVENVRYGKGSNAMGLLATLLVDGGGRVPRPLRFLGLAARHPTTFARSLSVRRWSERTVIGLVMQSVDNSLTVSARRHPWLARLGLSPVGLTSRQGHGAPNPSWIPSGHEAVRRLAARLTQRTGVPAYPGGTISDVLNVPMTAHFLGGCVIGATPDDGVVDPYQRLHGYPGLHVVDGSTVSANLGVNPSLTIAAQAERAMSFWPNKGEPDARPSPGSPYRRTQPVPALHPAVPTSAPVLLPTPVTR
jgi:cholesterol oxidase